MPGQPLSKPQADVDNVIFDIVDRQRTFDSNYGNRVLDIHRDILFNATVATATGLLVGGLVGAIVGMRRS